MAGLQDNCRASPVPRQAAPPPAAGPLPVAGGDVPRGWQAIAPAGRRRKKGEPCGSPSYSQTGP
ncbi:hypothetical protein DESPIGER_1802 [Desulfovibrio piger]|uniref:Uncharacterized protein n=1 Tax=Desulfovibrio piger TaxID=901 RepID=A0A1K1LG08_9BACT|nr:hypothetical protein DESPIGER_1802 [Desulfovibrio piger]